jgi:hypothetical protein
LVQFSCFRRVAPAVSRALTTHLDSWEPCPHLHSHSDAGGALVLGFKFSTLLSRKKNKRSQFGRSFSLALSLSLSLRLPCLMVFKPDNRIVSHHITPMTKQFTAGSSKNQVALRATYAMICMAAWLHYGGSSLYHSRTLED